MPNKLPGIQTVSLEMLVHRLALDAGLRVAEAKLQAFGKGHRTFMTRRFDRVKGSGGHQRIHFA